MERRVPVQSSRSMYLCGAWEQKVGAMNREPSRLHTLPWASGTGKAATMKQQVYAVRWTGGAHMRSLLPDQSVAAGATPCSSAAQGSQESEERQPQPPAPKSRPVPSQPCCRQRGQGHNLFEDIQPSLAACKPDMTHPGWWLERRRLPSMVGKRSWGQPKRRRLAGSAPGMGEVEPRYVAPWPGIHEMIVTNLR